MFSDQRGFKKLQYQCKTEVCTMEYSYDELKACICFTEKTRSQEMSGWKLVKHTHLGKYAFG